MGHELHNGREQDGDAENPLLESSLRAFHPLRGFDPVSQNTKKGVVPWNRAVATEMAFRRPVSDVGHCSD
jgi:hypothetical protein